MAPTNPIGRDPATGKLMEFVSTGTDAFMPTLIAAAATFTIPADKQGLAALPIVIDGTLIIDGSLVML
jgi:hypothetical protein